MSQRKERTLSESWRSSEEEVRQSKSESERLVPPKYGTELQQDSKQALKNTGSEEKVKQMTTIQYFTEKGR